MESLFSSIRDDYVNYSVWTDLWKEIVEIEVWLSHFPSRLFCLLSHHHFVFLQYKFMFAWNKLHAAFFFICLCICLLVKLQVLWINLAILHSAGSPDWKYSAEKVMRTGIEFSGYVGIAWTLFLSSLSIWMFCGLFSCYYLYHFVNFHFDLMDIWCSNGSYCNIKPCLIWYTLLFLVLLVFFGSLFMVKSYMYIFILNIIIWLCGTCSCTWSN